MFIIRPIRQEDTEKFIEIAYDADIGMTSMPRNPHLLVERVAESEKAFSKQVIQPNNEKYLFVLEDTETKHIVATCGIVANNKDDRPTYRYRIDEKLQKPSFTQSFPEKIPILRKVQYFETPSELCSLYIDPKQRHGGIGRLLSLSRLLFIASFPKRFDKMIYAEMRGDIDENNNSKFWDGIGRHFYDIDFITLMRLEDENAIDITTLLPEYPIYIALLPKNVQESIGNVHAETRPALNMLIQEGFYHTNDIHPLDGGPIIEAEVAHLRTVKYSIVDRIAKILDEPIKGSRFIISNNRLNFRACYGMIQHFGHHGIGITREVANALEVNIGDLIRYVDPIGTINEPPSEI